MKRLRILHLEDDLLDAELVEATLQEAGLGCKCVRVDNRRDFHKALEEGRFDLILADYSLPSFDGVTALAMAQSLRPRLPFIFLSGALGEERAIETLKSGATDYVLKQRLDRLPSSIARALRESEARNERERAQESLLFLAAASITLGTSLDYETTLSHLVSLTVPALGDFCLVDVLDIEGVLHLEAANHVQPERCEQLREMRRNFPLAKRRPLSAQLAMQQGESLLIEQVTEAWLRQMALNEEHFQHLLALNAQSCLMVPLQARGRTLGTITFTTLQRGEPTPNAGRRYDAHDLALAQSIAGRAALAIDNARLHRETQDALRARDEFLATLSHELRTPLNSMLGWTQLLRSGSLDAEMSAQALEIIERNTKAQAQLIEDLLEVSRIITGKLRLEVRPVELGEVVTNALETVRLAAEAKSIAIEYSIGRAGVVAGDAHRLQQVVWNLLSNAIKFTPKGGSVTVSLDVVDSYVRLSVGDNGQGIAPDFLPHVFERFRQADSSSTRTFGGLGLGLGIVRQLVELHGGTVAAHSEGENLGATFTVKLPLMAVQIAPDKGIPATGEPLHLGSLPDVPCAQLDGVRVLVVDDQEDARHLIAAVLEGCGAQVTTASSASEALQHMETERFDLLLSDIGMPGEDGYWFIQRVRELPNQSARIPALALTAYARESDRDRALASGFQAHGVKPIEPAKLIELVAQLIKKK